MKNTILKAYELVPEAYRQQFRSSQKQNSQTFTDFSREKEAQLDRWCTAKEVGRDFDKLCQLILLEEFKGSLPPQVKTYLDERKVENLHQAAIMVDDYSLTHKSTFVKEDKNSVVSKGVTVMDYHQRLLVMEVARTTDRRHIHTHLEATINPVFLPAIIVRRRPSQML